MAQTKPFSFWRILVVGLCFVLIMTIRFYQTQLFYDPFVLFFQSDFVNTPFPEVVLWKYALSMTFRYVLNTVLSLGILWACFQNVSQLKFATLLYGFFYLVLLGGILIFLTLDGRDYQVFFYLRRFLIQPLFLLLFLPAFFYQEKVQSTK